MRMDGLGWFALNSLLVVCAGMRRLMSNFKSAGVFAGIIMACKNKMHWVCRCILLV